MATRMCRCAISLTVLSGSPNSSKDSFFQSCDSCELGFAMILATSTTALAVEADATSLRTATGCPTPRRTPEVGAYEPFVVEVGNQGGNVLATSSRACS